MPSSALASSPISAIRRAISRVLKPASTKTRVPLATSNTALPVEPLPSTVSFIAELHHKDTKNTRKKTKSENCFEQKECNSPLFILCVLGVFVVTQLLRFPNANDRRRTRSSYPALRAK